MILGIRTRIIYDFLVIIQGSYMISLVSYKDRTKKSSMDSMKSSMILVRNQRNFNPGILCGAYEFRYFTYKIPRVLFDEKEPDSY